MRLAIGNHLTEWTLQCLSEEKTSSKNSGNPRIYKTQVESCCSQLHHHLFFQSKVNKMSQYFVKVSTCINVH